MYTSTSSSLANYSSVHPPHRVSHPSICLPTVDCYSTSSSTSSITASRRRKNSVTGTRKYITPSSLLPLDAPIQPRKYLSPSSTSRKDAFPGMNNTTTRCSAAASGDEQDELVEDPLPSPRTAELQQQLEWKRRQNTLAARKSRQRKLQHQMELEETVKALASEKETWKARALMYEALLRSNGIKVPELS